jgi:hypothetical protein
MRLVAVAAQQRDGTQTFGGGAHQEHRCIEPSHPDITSGTDSKRFPEHTAELRRAQLGDLRQGGYLDTVFQIHLNIRDNSIETRHDLPNLQTTMEKA